MFNTAPIYKVVLQTGTFILIEDVGPWEHHTTVTNGAELVVGQLIASGKLQKHQRMFYIDSDRMFGEMLFDIVNGFAGFEMPKDQVAVLALEAWKQVEKHTRKGS